MREYCLACNIDRIYPICLSCSQDPFKVEDVRRRLAEINAIKDLKKTYDEKLAEIPNLNTPSIWDKKLDNVEILEKQDGMTKDRIAVTISYIPKTANKILDLGAGYGFLEEGLCKAQRNFEVHGIDISKSGIRMLKKRFNGEFLVASVYEIPYPVNFFDVVFALELLEHIPPKNIFTVLREIKRILKANGILIVSVPLNEGLKHRVDNPSGHAREYSQRLILKEFEIAGFKVLTSRLLFAFQSLYIVKKILQKILWFRWKPNDIVVKVMKV